MYPEMYLEQLRPVLETMSRRARRALARDLRRQGPNAVNTINMALNLAGANTNAYQSQAIWSSCPEATFRDDKSAGVIFEPLTGVNVPIFATTVAQMGLITLQDTGVTIGGDPTDPGTLAWGGQDADNDAGIITADGNVGTSFVFSSTTPRELWFEVGLKKSIVTDNSMAFFAGLTEEGMAAATNTLLATDSANLADKDLIGFHVDQADGDSIDFVYNKASAGGVTVKISGLSAIAAATWIKLGFHYNPNAPTARRIAIFVNNVEQSTYVTGANMVAATFPDGEELTPTLAFKKGEATISTAAVRLWKCAQRKSAA